MNLSRELISRLIENTCAGGLWKRQHTAQVVFFMCIPLALQASQHCRNYFVFYLKEITPKLLQHSEYSYLLEAACIIHFRHTRGDIKELSGSFYFKKNIQRNTHLFDIPLKVYSVFLTTAFISREGAISKQGLRGIQAVGCSAYTFIRLYASNCMFTVTLAHGAFYLLYTYNSVARSQNFGSYYLAKETDLVV